MRPTSQTTPPPVLIVPPATNVEAALRHTGCSLPGHWQVSVGQLRVRHICVQAIPHE